jgi:hypothetical protein
MEFHLNLPEIISAASTVRRVKGLAELVANRCRDVAKDITEGSGDPTHVFGADHASNREEVQAHSATALSGNYFRADSARGAKATRSFCNAALRLKSQVLV